MSTDVEIKSNLIELKNPISLGSEISRIIASASVIEELEGMDEELKEVLRRSIDLWIIQISPIEYVPGLIDTIAMNIKNRLTRIFNEVSEEELAIVLDMVTEIKNKLENGIVPMEANEVEVRINKILKAIGINLSRLERFLNLNDSKKRLYRLISIFTIAIGISVMWDEKWIAEFQ
jgi:hypothetical protein